MYELPNDLRLRVLGNWEISGKSQNFIEELSSAHSSQNKNFVSFSTNLLKKLNFFLSRLFHMKTRVCLKYFVNDCLWKQLDPLDLFKFNVFDSFHNSKVFDSFNLELD